MRKKRKHKGIGKRLLDSIRNAESPEEVDEIYQSEATQSQLRGRGIYYYITGFDPKKGKEVLVGGYGSEEEAERIASSRGIIGFRVIELGTSNLAKASQLVKARKLHKGSMISDATEQLRHKGEDVGL